MLSSEWQAELDPEDASQDPDENLFRWNGNFAANPKVLGQWQLVGQVATIADFDPEQKTHPRNAPFSTITLQHGGGTTDPTWVWSGDTLMDLNRYQALKMQVRRVGNAEYLFVESGGFSTRNRPDWKSPLYVMKRD